jgi:hypothetical protein
MAGSINFRILQSNEIDKVLWDQKASLWNWNIYSYSFYLDAVTSNQWSAIVFGDYDYFFPFVKRKKWGLSYVCMPPYSQKYHIAGLPEEIVKAIFNYFKNNFLVFDIRVDISPKMVLNKNCIFKKTNYELPLNKEYEIIRSSYSSRLNRSLKNKDLLLLEWDHLDQAILFNQKHSFDKTFVDETAKAINKMPNEIVRSIIARTQDGTLVASLIYVQHEDRLYLILPTSNESGRKLQAMSILIDALVCKHANTNKIIDFEGSSIENIANFYRQFSPKETHYYYCKKRPLDIIR